MTDTEDSPKEVLQTDYSLIEECEICGGPVDTNEPGHHKSPDERFRHRVCHERGEPPEGYIREYVEEATSGNFACVNRQYNCGHVAYGPTGILPHRCPECGDNAV